MSAYSSMVESLGWEFFQTGPNEGDWLKFDSDGKQIGRAGDALWMAEVEPAWKKLIADCQHEHTRGRAAGYATCLDCFAMLPDDDPDLRKKCGLPQ